MSARYHTPYVAAPAEAGACALDLAELAVPDPTDPSTLPLLLADAERRVEHVAAAADPQRTPHAAITIDADADFEAPAGVSGVVSGTGTRDDPYVISGWQIRSEEPEVPAITITGTSKHVVVRNVTVSGGGWGIVVQRAAHVTIQDNRMLGMNAGALVLGLSGGAVTGNVVDGGEVGVLVQHAVSVDARTASVESTPTTDVVVSGNTTDGTAVGIAYVGSYDRFRDNEVTGNTMSRALIGVIAQDATDSVIAGNRYRATDYGLVVNRGGDRLTISDEDIQGATVMGLRLDGVSSADIQGVRVLDSTYGVLAAQGSAVRIAGATLEGNERGAVALYGSTLDIRGATFSGNRQFGAYAHGATLDASGSWWGATDGPSGCALGSGDAVACGVAVQPHRTVPPDA